MNTTKRLTVDAMLAAVGLVLFVIEMQIPPLTTIPGIKIGLANVVTLLAIRLFGKKDAAMVLFVRIVLGAVFAGNLSTFIYSISGGVLCYIVLCITFRFIRKPLWVLSIFGALAHNTGQILAAAALMASGAVFWYLPYLYLSAILAGAFTGLCAQFLIQRFIKPGKDR